jgi:hypothetical protein
MRNGRIFRNLAQKTLLVGKHCQLYLGSAIGAIVVAGILLTMLGFGAWDGWVCFGCKEGVRHGKRFV